MSQLAKYMIGIILFSMIVIGTTMYIKGFSDNYNVEVEPGWENTYNFAENMTTLGVDITEILESEDTNWLEAGLRMAYSALRGAFNIPKFMKGIFDNVAERLQIPVWVTVNIVVIVTLLIIFIITGALLRWYV